jgi:hypothetical protein
MARGCWPSGTDIPTIPGDLFAKLQTNFYADPVDAVFKALGVGSYWGILEVSTNRGERHELPPSFLQFHGAGAYTDPMPDCSYTSDDLSSTVGCEKGCRRPPAGTGFRILQRICAMATDREAPFRNQKYLNLEVFKRNGLGVKTPCGLCCGRMAPSTSIPRQNPGK